MSLALNRTWVKGDPGLAAAFDGKAYLFRDARARQVFVANPVRYAPALGGDNIVAFAKTGRRAPGDLRLGVTTGGRTFFVGNQKEREEFLANPQMYAAADLALGGDCVVCRVALQRVMPGSPELTMVYNGLRYRFAGAEQRQMFVTAPQRFEPEAIANTPMPARGGSGDRPPAGSGGSGSAGRGSEVRGSDGRGSKARGSGVRGPGVRGSDTRGSDARGSDARGSEARPPVGFGSGSGGR
ncbi:MAG: hypothetical protein AAF790_07570 [Planctomycetota bacterium]